MSRVERIRTLEQLDELGERWDTLYNRDPFAQVFLSWPWLRAYLPAGRHRWFVLALFDGDVLVAALPLARGGFPAPSLSFDRELYMGANPAGDYTGMLCEPGRDNEAIAAFAAAIAADGWENFNLCDTRDPRMERLAQRVAVTVGGSWERTEEGRCYAIALPADWDAYLKDGLDAKARKNTLRAMRRIAELPNFSFTEANADDAERHIEAVLALKQQRFGGKLQRWRARYAGMFRGAFATGSLRLFAMWDGDRPISAAAAFVDPATHTFSCYMRGHDREYDSLGPGRAMVGFLIRRAIADGYRTYDMLRGEESYKRDFTEHFQMVRSYRVTRPGWRASMVNAARPTLAALKLRLANIAFGGGRSA